MCEIEDKITQEYNRAREYENKVIEVQSKMSLEACTFVNSCWLVNRLYELNMIGEKQCPREDAQNTCPRRRDQLLIDVGVSPLDHRSLGVQSPVPHRSEMEILFPQIPGLNHNGRPHRRQRVHGAHV